MSTNKEKQTTKASGMEYTPEALMALMSQQAIRKDDSWKPSIVNYQASGVPTVQTQLAGTDFYDTTPNQFVAPGYEHFKDLSLKKDLQGKQDMSKWESVQTTLAGMNTSGNPTHEKVVENIRNAVIGYDEKLKKGVWGFNTNLVNDFTKDLTTNKGLSQLLAVQAKRAEAAESLKELSGKYNPVTGGGISPEDLDYYYKNLGTENDAQFDENNNLINSLTFTPSRVYEHRNLPGEIDTTTSSLKASTSVGIIDGKEMYQLGPNQYGIPSNERVTAEQIQTKVADYLYNNGGREYLLNKAKIDSYNQMKSGDLTTDKLRAIIADNIKTATAAGQESVFSQFDGATDEDLVKNASSILAANAYSSRVSSLTGASVAANAYTKDSLSFFNDQDALDRAKKAREATDEGAGISKFAITTRTSETVQFLNPTDSYSSHMRIIDIDENLMDLDTKIANLEKAGTYDNAVYSNYKAQRLELQQEKKNITTTRNNNVNGYGTWLREEEGISFNSFYTDYKANTKDPVNRDYFFSVLTAAMAAESDNDSGTTAAKVLAESKVGTSVKSDNLKGLGKYNGRKADIPRFDSRTPHIPEISYENNLVRFAEKTGGKIKQYYTDLNNNGKLIRNIPRSLQSDIVILNEIEGATSTDAAPSKYNNLFASLKKDYIPRLEGITMYDISGKAGMAVPTHLKEEFKIDPSMMTDVFDLDPNGTSAIRPTTTQTYGKAGQITYSLALAVKPTSDKDSSDVKRAKERIRAKIGANQFYEVRVGLGKNQETVDRQFGNAIYDMYMDGSLTKESVPPVVLQQMALTYGNTSGINGRIDKARLNSLDTGPSAKPALIELPDKNMHINAFSEDGGKTKMFTMEVEENGERAFITEDEDGNFSYHTQAEINKDKKLQKMVFKNDLDVKSFINLGILEDIRVQSTANANFKSGGGSTGTRVQFDRATAPTYQTQVTYVNGKKETHTAYVPTADLVNISKSGVDVSGTTGIPMVHKDAAPAAINLAKRYGLVVTGGLRTNDHQVKGGAKNSKHFAGYSLDIKNNKQGIAMYNAVKADPKLKKQLGIAYIDMHDRGSGMHVHVEFEGADRLGASSKGVKIQPQDARMMDAIGMGESNGDDSKGYHYTDRKAASSAYGKYGFTDTWFPKIAAYNNMTVAEVRKRPDLIDIFAKTEYIRLADKEIKPIFTKAKSKLGKFIPNFSREDAMFIYHYVGGSYFKDLVDGKKSLYDVPAGNRLNIIQYVKDKRKYL